MPPRDSTAELDYHKFQNYLLFTNQLHFYFYIIEILQLGDINR
jgi:hypothetical protein